MHTSGIVAVYNSLNAFSRSLGHSQGGISKDNKSEDYRTLELTEQIEDVKHGAVYSVVYSSVHLSWMRHCYMKCLYVPFIQYSNVVVMLYLMHIKLRYLSLSLYVLDWHCHFNNCVIFNFVSFVLPP